MSLNYIPLHRREVGGDQLTLVGQNIPQNGAPFCGSLGVWWSCGGHNSVLRFFWPWSGSRWSALDEL